MKHAPNTLLEKLFQGSMTRKQRITRRVIKERLEESRVLIEQYIDERRNSNTERAYLVGLRYFWAWSHLTWGVTRIEYPIPAPIIEAYVYQQLEGFPKEVEEGMIQIGAKRGEGPSKLATIEQRLWALNRAHREQVEGIDPRYVFTPKVRELLRAAKTDAFNRPKKSTALDRERLNRMIDALDDMPPIYATMMRALIAVGWGSGGRRVSEIIAFSVKDLTRKKVSEPPGWMFELKLGKRKNVKAAELQKTLPVRGRAAQWLSEWLELREELNIEGDPLFRAVRLYKRKQDTTKESVQESISATWIWDHLKKLSEKAGIDGHITPHSIRVGFATQAIRDRISVKDAMAMTDHKSFKVFMGYVEEDDLMKSDAGNLL